MKQVKPYLDMDKLANDMAQKHSGKAGDMEQKSTATQHPDTSFDRDADRSSKKRCGDHINVDGAKRKRMTSGASKSHNSNQAIFGSRDKTPESNGSRSNMRAEGQRPNYHCNTMSSPTEIAYLERRNDANGASTIDMGLSQSGVIFNDSGQAATADTCVVDVPGGAALSSNPAATVIELVEAGGIDQWLAGGLSHATQLANHLPNDIHYGAEAGIDLPTGNIHNAYSLANFFPAVDPWLVNGLNNAARLPDFLGSDLDVIDPWLTNGLNNAARLLSFSEPWLDSSLNEASRLSQYVQEEIGHRAVEANDLNDPAPLGIVV
ncbi:hypothetical protein BJ875DRAFT_122682 [Amylocarpus encephaloides]|uniref:Uncharacterized protein n=1 Tax=Amylocarpus encephaloides TaxID=45428 RepID=A0A9P8C3W0_9HELO|nr:hypothetical protein BJ875DRAFT_122682 [Amylocarpus encephaloides]